MPHDYSICCPRCLTQYRIKQSPQGRKIRCSHCGNSYTHSADIKKQIKNDPLIGASFGAATITKLIASGGMGHVYLAHHTLLDIPIAIKTLKPEFSQNTEFTKRFYREARIAAKIHHPNIVTIIDCGKSNGLHYLSMEYVEGTTLRELVFEESPLSQHRACSCMLQVINALEHAASLNIIHRDIKPANIMIEPNGNLKLADMGLARSVDSDTVDLCITQVGSAIGTPAYMPPEQARDATSVDLRGDIYSLGASFYFITSGKNPFQGNTQFDLLQKAATEEAPPLHEINTNITPEFDALIRKMMAKKPEDRYQSWAEVREALQKIEQNSSDDSSPALGEHTGVCPHTQKRSKLLPILIFSLFVACAVVVYLQRHRIKSALVHHNTGHKPSSIPLNKSSDF